MKQTVKKWLESIEDETTRSKALAHMDQRYADTECYCLSYAVMLGVHHHENFADKQFWQAFQAAEVKKSFTDCSAFYQKQEVQQEDHSGKKR